MQCIPLPSTFSISRIHLLQFQSMEDIVRVVFLMEMMISALRIGVDGRLSINYYLLSCPFAEQIVTDTVSKALVADPSLAASLLRMHFHDCFIQGCDASILIDSTEKTAAEKDSPANQSLRGFEVIEEAKSQLESQCPGIVSCADIVAMAARDSVFLAGGPLYEIPKGRKDGRVSEMEDTINLPFPSFNASQLIAAFSRHAFSAQEMVALSGAHTLGMARCSSFISEVSTDDGTLDLKFAEGLKKRCSQGGSGGEAQEPLDVSRNTFDNLYFKMLLRKSGLLFSDRTLLYAPETRAHVARYAANQAAFFFDFQTAMLKMGMLYVKNSSNGEVRSTRCSQINAS